MATATPVDPIGVGFVRFQDTHRGAYVTCASTLSSPCAPSIRDSTSTSSCGLSEAEALQVEGDWSAVGPLEDHAERRVGSLAGRAEPAAFSAERASHDPDRAERAFRAEHGEIGIEDEQEQDGERLDVAALRKGDEELSLDG